MKHFSPYATFFDMHVCAFDRISLCMWQETIYEMLSKQLE